jgi:hypothetical protein
MFYGTYATFAVHSRIKSQAKSNCNVICLIFHATALFNLLGNLLKQFFMRSFKHLLFVAGVCTIVLLTDATLCAMGQQSPRLFIVDQLAADASENISNANAADEIFILPDTGNPLAVITDKLKERNFSEIHLYLLTKPGSMIFDELTILKDNVGECAAHFREWKKNLSPGAKIIIHSDTLVSVPEGASLIEQIAELTGATVLVQD